LFVYLLQSSIFKLSSSETIISINDSFINLIYIKSLSAAYSLSADRVTRVSTMVMKEIFPINNCVISLNHFVVIIILRKKLMPIVWISLLSYHSWIWVNIIIWISLGYKTRGLWTVWSSVELRRMIEKSVLLVIILDSKISFAFCTSFCIQILTHSYELSWLLIHRHRFTMLYSTNFLFLFLVTLLAYYMINVRMFLILLNDDITTFFPTFFCLLFKLFRSLFN